MGVVPLWVLPGVWDRFVQRFTVDSKKLEHACRMIDVAFLLFWSGVGGQSCSHFLASAVTLRVHSTHMQGMWAFCIRIITVALGRHFLFGYFNSQRRLYRACYGQLKRGDLALWILRGGVSITSLRPVYRLYSYMEPLGKEID